jgi:hypothetical protein
VVVVVVSPQWECSSRARGGLCNGDKHVHITPM